MAKTPKIPGDSSPRNYLSVETVIAERIVFQKQLEEEVKKEEQRLTLERITQLDFADKHVNVFDEMNRYREDVGKGIYAMTWMKNAITDLYDMSEDLHIEEKYFRDDKRIVTKRWIKKPGEMYLFNYNPLNKSKLDYYDTFPLIFIIEEYSDGFLGMNLHYLPIPLRERLFLNLLTYASGEPDTESETVRLKITYDLLNKTSKLRFFRPCVRRYKYNRIDSRLLRIPSKDWIIAMYLPIERFQKRKRGRVWHESRKQIAERVRD